MLTTEEYIQYGMYLCRDYYYDKKTKICKSDCPFLNKDFCVFPSTVVEINRFDKDFALKTVEDFKEKVNKKILQNLILEKLPKAKIEDILVECPKKYFGNEILKEEDCINCFNICAKGKILNKKRCWDKEVIIAPDKINEY